MRALVSSLVPPSMLSGFSPPASRNPNPNPSPIIRSASFSTAETQVSTEPAADSLGRRLILLRHAEGAILSDRSRKDHDRPLSKNGRSDAARMARKLQQMGWIPELILSRFFDRLKPHGSRMERRHASPNIIVNLQSSNKCDAKRTKETLQIMQEQVHEFSEADIYFVPSFYSIAAMDGQTAEHLSKVICQYSTDNILTVMCMGHNKGWEEAASMFSGATVDLKTCNAALLEATGRSWTEVFALCGLGGWKLHAIVKPNSEL